MLQKADVSDGRIPQKLIIEGTYQSESNRRKETTLMYQTERTSLGIQGVEEQRNQAKDGS